MNQSATRHRAPHDHCYAVRTFPAIILQSAGTNSPTQNARCREHFRLNRINRDMKPPYSLSPRSSLAKVVLHVSGVALLALGASGCARRAIVVQAPPATVIQSPAPAPAPASTTVIQAPPAAAPAPTGRDVIFVKEAPPPPRDEPPPPPAPSSEYKWVPGYWMSRDGRQEWVAGHWEMPPRTSATWVSPRWERRGDGYVFIEGYWR